jgi:hypothetical protein
MAILAGPDPAVSNEPVIISLACCLITSPEVLDEEGEVAASCPNLPMNSSKKWIHFEISFLVGRIPSANLIS